KKKKKQTHNYKQPKKKYIFCRFYKKINIKISIFDFTLIKKNTHHPKKKKKPKKNKNKNTQKQKSNKEN
ncbi:hypothetical protein ACSTIV_00425, partial [Vibrio parahaemolyticus]